MSGQRNAGIVQRIPTIEKQSHPDADLETRFRDALAAMPAGYVPRTHHLVDGNPSNPRFINRLIFETSPYLLQHAHNPVNWYPWGDEAFATARRDGKPVFLSIGYSTCHWCHVMEAESFEDLAIAEVMNRDYVCIKVDREERPDVDAVYMSAVQNLTGHGGWPMSVWLNADRDPFMAGTYFPPRAGVRGSRRGFLELMVEIRVTFDREPARVVEAAKSLADAIRESLEGRAEAGDGALPDARAIAATVAHFAHNFDETHGGLRRIPKFPSTLPIRLLLRHHEHTVNLRALNMAVLTLEKMAAGGLYDQIGGGFHRYSTDGVWLVPHFEKMLYDNALLVVAYAEAHQVTGRADFARVVREVLDYVLREMTSSFGGFYSATDADSEGEEGKFFVWSESEIETLLGKKAEDFKRHYGVAAVGNYEGHNILHVAEPDETVWASLADARQTLYAVRAKRIAPLRDDKILTAWNGLMISGFAIGGRVLNESSYIQSAARAADFVLQSMRHMQGLCRSYKDGKTLAHAFLEDYAFLIQGLLDLYQAGFELRHLVAALDLAEEMERRFSDEDRGGWYSIPHDGEQLLAREKPAYDGAEPSGTSVAILNAARLHGYTGDSRWRSLAERALQSVASVLRTRGPAMTEGLVALDFFIRPTLEIAIVWPQGQGALAEPLLQVLRRTFVSNRVVVACAEGEDLQRIARVVPFVAGKIAKDGRPTAYVCRYGQCERPTTDPSEFAAQLAANR
jgi:uncharacterized protein